MKNSRFISISVLILTLIGILFIPVSILLVLVGLLVSNYILQNPDHVVVRCWDTRLHPRPLSTIVIPLQGNSSSEASPFKSDVLWGGVVRGQSSASSSAACSSSSPSSSCSQGLLGLSILPSALGEPTSFLLAVCLRAAGSASTGYLLLFNVPLPSFQLSLELEARSRATGGPSPAQPETEEPLPEKFQPTMLQSIPSSGGWVPTAAVIAVGEAANSAGEQDEAVGRVMVVAEWCEKQDAHRLVVLRAEGSFENKSITVSNLHGTGAVRKLFAIPCPSWAVSKGSVSMLVGGVTTRDAMVIGQVTWSVTDRTYSVSLHSGKDLLRGAGEGVVDVCYCRDYDEMCALKENGECTLYRCADIMAGLHAGDDVREAAQERLPSQVTACNVKRLSELLKGDPVPFTCDSPLGVKVIHPPQYSISKNKRSDKE